MSNKIPVYIEMHNKMRQLIVSNEWKKGNKIPSERDLADEFNVSRMTARQAVSSLVEEGLLERKRGSGTFVASEKVREKLSGIPSFTETIEKLGKTPSSKLVSYYTKRASESESEKLAIHQDEMVLVMERIRYANGEPICFEVATLPLVIIKTFSKEQLTKHLYRTLSDNGYEVARAEQTLSATLASEKVADLLQIKRESPILRLRQVSYTQDSTPFEYVRAQYVGSRYEFFLEALK
ncbi:GntR family transcriptional regulator [Alkalibacterium olivapovliticus]|uniref:GntR family transcriptional regulator n=1 Tax=Alkalibacterium olivapovliticus TaxID=99907 RepID=A0A2T0W9V7_9LACT|nr:GntR family transcriptional regulator [Alkalibacterium olivapovliticus]PRY83480.1 GntR family transcriptional regulator [Alkalibacterium olivapovliticus]